MGRSTPCSSIGSSRPTRSMRRYIRCGRLSQKLNGPRHADLRQRQITKLGLSDKMLDQGSAGQGSKDCRSNFWDPLITPDSRVAFSLAELKDIFRLKLHTDGCQTRESPTPMMDSAELVSDDLLCCKCIEPKADDSEPVSQNGMEEEEVERPTFTSAARYDPEPVSRSYFATLPS